MNLPGVDLIGPGGTTYESKVTQFSNKSQMAVRGLILKNRRQAGDYEDDLAEYFVITDVKKVRHVVFQSQNFTISKIMVLRC